MGKRQLSPRPGKILIISSPSGGGKTSICRKLLSRSRREAGWQFSISYTTRKPRVGERNGRSYYFVSDDKFDQLVKQDFFAEHFKVHLYKYGTPRKPLEAVRQRGGVMVLDVDVQGARRLRKEYPHAISIFVLPPSRQELVRRLKQRGTESPEQLKIRIDNALHEMQTFRRYGFDYVVVNQELKEAVKDVLHIVEAHPHRVELLDPELLQRITG
ncbi:guanylate kinase [candidate division GN15 bacterium]|nr:guanylate kinase [candidate division GN15 bacterium]